jgi:hypothetical protein
MVIKIIGFGILSALTAYLLSELGFRGKRIYSTLIISLFLLYFIGSLEGIFYSVLSLDIGESAVSAIKTSLKILGISQSFSLASAVASELSEVGISNVLDLVGKLEIIMIALPYIKDVITFASDLFCG